VADLKTRFQTPTPYAAWFVFSGAALVAAWAADPYILGFAAFAAAAISGVLVAASVFLGLRPFVFATLAALPTILSFALLSTYKWA
jgi:hypothetical protein